MAKFFLKVGAHISYKIATELNHALPKHSVTIYMGAFGSLAMQNMAARLASLYTSGGKQKTCSPLPAAFFPTQTEIKSPVRV